MSLHISNNINDTTRTSDLGNSQVSPCFSFKKQPIPSRISCHSAISSFIEPDQSLLQASRDQHAQQQLQLQQQQQQQQASSNFTTEQDYHLNYDEQIRAPRMSTLSKTNSMVKIAEHEPLGDCDYLHRNSNDSKMSNEEFSNSSRNTSATSNTSMGMITETKSEQELSTAATNATTTTKLYCPATYDLSQSSRRYSSPSVHYEQQQQSQAVQSPKRQPTYAEIAKRALQNLQTNSGASCETLKRKDPRERICTDGPIRQIDEPKTPNYIPAVLRPPNFQSSNHSHNVTRKTSFSSLGENGIAPDDVPSNASSSPTRLFSPSYTASSSPTRFMELPRDHWVPNNERSACSLCHSKFSIINRKHHCRKCGDIFCMNCCYIRASLNFKLNFDLINGVVSRVCNDCGIQYNQYIRKTFVHPHHASTSEGIDDGNVDLKDKVDLLEKERKGSTQVPVDWNWSSF